jgi:hypothetical protein
MQFSSAPLHFRKIADLISCGYAIADLQNETFALPQIIIVNLVLRSSAYHLGDPVDLALIPGQRALLFNAVEVNFRYFFTPYFRN